MGWRYSNAHCCLSWPKPCCSWLKPRCDLLFFQSNGKANWDWSEPRQAEAVQSLLSSRPVSAATATAPSASVLELTSSSPCPPELVGENFLSTNRLTLLLHPLPHRASGASVGDFQSSSSSSMEPSPVIGREGRENPQTVIPFACRLRRPTVNRHDHGTLAEKSLRLGERDTNIMEPNLRLFCHEFSQMKSSSLLSYQTMK